MVAFNFIYNRNTDCCFTFYSIDEGADMKVRLTAALDKRGFVCVWRAGH